MSVLEQGRVVDPSWGLKLLIHLPEEIWESVTFVARQNLSNTNFTPFWTLKSHVRILMEWNSTSPLVHIVTEMPSWKIFPIFSCINNSYKFKENSRTLGKKSTFQFVGYLMPVLNSTLILFDHLQANLPRMAFFTPTVLLIKRVTSIPGGRW